MIARLLAWGATAVVVAFVVFCLVWRVEGGRWERVESPSMGTVAPVGTLLWVKPVDFAQLRPGDFISFRPPGSHGVTYSHRVLRRYADGTISTKGVIPGPDPWRLHADDIVGEVRMHWRGVGWLVAAAPVLVVGGLLTGGLGLTLRRRWRPPVSVLMGSMVLTVAIVWLHPFVGAEQVAFAPAAGGGADATYVGTGLLPVRLQAFHGPHVDIGDGQVGTVHVGAPDAHRRLRISLRPAVPMWWWLVLVAVCFLPALWSLAMGVPSEGRRRISDHAVDRGPRSPGRRARARRHARRPGRPGLRSAPSHRARTV